MPRPKTQGGFANSSGSVLEGTIRSVMTSMGFEAVKYSDYVKHPERYGTELLLQNVPYKTIYGHEGKTEFLLVSSEYNLCVRIECKWQQSPGSVDEKYPYVYLNAVEAMPEEHILIVLGGQGAKKGAIDWLKQTAAQGRYGAVAQGKKIEVMSLDEFIAWANRTFRG
ncbi:4-diphosphocytidyl-2C-methyl-D-erythritol kinase (plasmid) [Alicyclobacillus sp. TC]|uniref:PD-(D/E)XK nuclease domain-containing protein n=1 Tax=Alicyclobacillus tolerans TaxID=90970 RepID=A0ABT9LYL1_9BACL|nr:MULTISPECIES: PD-(D/E)XK nuclease superfamily protein [Alicyclobacillus]MDP9729360.1 hypothetical protein [Alicyclobacillus tengchongensis]QRF24857.1 4-diphosphocytidyl-2C-methyl-D-erythritol kinase [Alicyclobacillus sp. TC]